MKKVIALLIAMAMILTLGAACQQKAETYEIALVTDVGTIDDQSFNQGTWEGIVDYAEANEKTYKYYQPTEDSTAARLAAIQLAVDGGAKIIACPGFLFEETLFEAQDMYPEVSFILIDAQPHDADYNYRTAENVACILYAEEQSGYLAGYAAVKDGYTKLGFMGGMAVPAVVRFGYGFVQGADAAAQELGIESIEMMYHYTGGFAATPEAQTLASSWYSSGTEVIFSCGGGLFASVFAAAEEAGAKSIGVDTDQSFLSESVITSATKGLAASVVEALTLYYADNFPGGTTTIMDAAKNGVTLPMETSKFNTFSQADYDALYAKLAAGEISILTDTVGTELENVTKLGTVVTNITPVQ